MTKREIACIYLGIVPIVWFSCTMAHCDETQRGHLPDKYAEAEVFKEDK